MEEEEAAADLAAFQREYEDDHSWEALQEDEFGRLRPLVCLGPWNIAASVCAGHARACVECLLLSKLRAYIRQQSTIVFLERMAPNKFLQDQRGSCAPSSGRCPAQREPSHHGPHRPAPGQQAHIHQRSTSAAKQG